MGNKHKGEISFTVAGTPYVLIMNHNAFCEMESVLGRPYPDVAMEMQEWAPPLGPDDKALVETEEQLLLRSRKIRFATVRAVFWAGLQERHPNVTLHAAGNLISDMGGARVALGLICDSLLASMPDQDESRADESASAGASENPPKPGESSAPATGSAS